MGAYVPNIGEKEDLKAQLALNAVQLILYKNLVIPDGNTIAETLEELPTGGGYGYAPKELAPVIVEDALAADKWYLSLNAAGKAQAQYHNAALQWVMTANDTALGNTCHGVAGYCWVLPFDAGGGAWASAKPREIQVGDKIKGNTSNATGIVTGVMVSKGSWAAGTAEGWINIMTKTGTFQNDEEIRIYGGINATSLGNAAGTGYAVGDLFKIIEAGASGGIGVVLTVNAGAVVTFGIVCPGQGYTVANNKATAKITGAGDDALTVDVDSVVTTKLAETNTGATGDAHKRLLFVEPMTTPTAIDTVGQPFNVTPILTVATAT